MTVVDRRLPARAPAITAELPVVRTSPLERKPVNPSRASALILGSVTLLALFCWAALWSTLLGGGQLIVASVASLAVVATLTARGHFRIRMVPDTTSRAPLVAVAVAMGAMSALAVASTGLAAQPDAPSFVHLLAGLGAAALAAQAVGVEALRRQWKAGRLRSKALVLGADELARELAIEMSLRREYGVDVVGFLSHDGSRAGILPAPVYHPEADLGEVFANTEADRLLVAPAPAVSDAVAIRAARWAGSKGIPVFVVPRMYEMGLGLDSMTPDRARGYPLVRLQRAAHPQVSLRVKRVMDVVIAGGVLILASPVMALAAVAVKLSSPGPVLFGQQRVGQHGRFITVWKFRSMTVSPTSDVEWAAESRITPVGALLRRSNIDELPQLWSIVRGEMSLVGPRPERPAFVEQFRREVPDYDDRHRMPVGLTGLAQVAGLRGDTSIAERAKYDNLYIDQWSVGADVLIIAKTLKAISRQNRQAEQAVHLHEALASSSQGWQISPSRRRKIAPPCRISAKIERP